ncbi:MAG TPA: hypothetical protein VJY35_05500 [Candidatus Eisenbacteria bacterium]|nr:hypothetical protein [Candidatus Eisenbacteria bacterium]
MRAAKQLLVVLALTGLTAMVHTSLASAQGSPGNPSGGTWLRQTQEEATGPVLPTDFLSRGFALNMALSGWINTRLSAYYTSSVVLEKRTAMAVTRRRVGAR